jgi:hypothetical protein
MSVKRLVPIHALAHATDPIGNTPGEIYYNTTDEELKYFDGASWHSVSGAITGLLDHIHSYDGSVYSVSANTVASDGTLDGGTPFSDYGNLPGNLDAGEA